MNYEAGNKRDNTLKKKFKKIRYSHEHKKWFTVVYMNEFPDGGRVQAEKLQKLHSKHINED